MPCVKKKKKIVLEVYLTKIKNYSKNVYNLFVTKNLQSINLDTTFGKKIIKSSLLIDTKWNFSMAHHWNTHKYIGIRNIWSC